MTYMLISFLDEVMMACHSLAWNHTPEVGGQDNGEGSF